MKDKDKKYNELFERISSVLTETLDLISSMATVASLVKETFPELLWVGFYRTVEDLLLVGPYQGPIGCTEIKYGKGVCGKCAQKRKSIIVPDVHKFEGHIACDCRANSEIVVPCFDVYGELIAVLDIDSTEFNAFDDIDRQNLERIVKLLSDKKIVV